jgi:hypothetical protein
MIAEPRDRPELAIAVRESNDSAVDFELLEITLL